MHWFLPINNSLPFLDRNLQPVGVAPHQNMGSRLAELRKWMQDRMVEDIRIVRTIEDRLEECETDRSCRVVTSSRVEEGLVSMVEDGTCSQQVSVEYRGEDTRTREGAGNNKHFIDVRVTSSVLLDRIGRQDIVPRDWLRMDRVKCVREVEDGDLRAVFRFMVLTWQFLLSDLLRIYSISIYIGFKINSNRNSFSTD